MLNNFLKQNNIDVIMVPSVDEFFGEYVSKDRNRLLKATGFSGSNGIAVIGFNKSVLLTDGRYLEQAKKELPNNFEIIDLSLQTLSQYLESLGSIKIGFLEELHTINNIKKLPQHLIPISCEKIDKILNIDTHFVESQDKIIKIGEVKTDIISNLKIKDTLLICDPASVCWLLNIRGKSVEYSGLFNCYLAIFKDNSYKIINNLYDITNIFDKSKEIETDFNQVNFHLYSLLEQKLSHKTNPIIPIKAIKNEAEITGMKRANKEDSLAINKFIKWIKTEIANDKKITEIEAIQKLLSFRKENPNFIEQSFATIMGSGPNSSIIHYNSSEKTNKIIEKNSILLIDSGGHYNYYGTSDITRTISTGGTVDNRIKTDYTLVLKGHIAVATAIFLKGTTGAQIDILARQYLWKNGKDYNHGTGHGVGYYLSVHEGPCSISKKCNVALEEGMILSNEPGFYLPNEYGIRIENLMLVKKHESFKDMLCFETISFVDFEDDFIDQNMLTNVEKEYINNLLVKKIF